MTDAKRVLAWLERKGTKKGLADHERFGITATRPFGVSVGELRKEAKRLGTDHDLALALWKSGRYEARMLATMVADPERTTSAQMDAWTKGFDNWAIVDTACFTLFDRTRHAWGKVGKWTKAKPLFTRRAGFALLWSLSTHDKEAEDERFLEGLELVEEYATDDRDYVKKAVDMALRAVGKRNVALNAAARETAERLAASDDPTARWIGLKAGRELASASVRKRLGAKRAKKA